MRRTYGMPDVHGNARIDYDDGSWYFGESNKDVRCGLGAYYHTDGTIECGYWDDDNLIRPIERSEYEKKRNDIYNNH